MRHFWTACWTLWQLMLTGESLVVLAPSPHAVHQLASQQPDSSAPFGMVSEAPPVYGRNHNFDDRNANYKSDFDDDVSAIHMSEYRGGVGQSEITSENIAAMRQQLAYGQAGMSVGGSLGIGLGALDQM